MNFIVMTVKGRRDLTETCFRTMKETLLPDEDPHIVLIDAATEVEDKVWYDDLKSYYDTTGLRPVYLFHKDGFGISKAWNEGIQLSEMAAIKPMGDDLVWLLNNDVAFKRSGWLTALSDRLLVPGTGMVGTYGMSVFGLPFVTGGIWGFRLSVALEVAEDGKVLDERLNWSCQDVDLSVRIAKAGYTVTHVPGIEWGENPMLVHGISQTMLSERPLHELYKMREPERRVLIDKHERRDGKIGYDGVVEQE